MTDIGTSEGMTGKMTVDFMPSKPTKFRILGTDYDNFYVKYTCSEAMWPEGMFWEGWAIMSR